ncbi:GbsR/MarR family transcriptional regulator [Gaopeijia maritima]|uniref:MarR family transcriptional regulator n=1 Tax=Gaopeijia maritima TaxID=3119007 RepID=A0ABU9EBE9_9BACT
MNEQHQKLIERMGRYYEADGLPRIAGRLFGYLLLEDEARSLDEMAAALAVSKTSVSTNARLLEQTGLLERVTRPGDRKDYYQLAADQSRMIELKMQGMQEMQSILESAAAVADESGADPSVRKRIRSMYRFNVEAYQVVTQLLESWTPEE